MLFWGIHFGSKRLCALCSLTPPSLRKELLLPVRCGAMPCLVLRISRKSLNLKPCLSRRKQMLFLTEESLQALGLCGKVLAARVAQVWLLWEATRSFTSVWKSQHQPAPKWTCCWPRSINNSHSASVIAHLRRRNICVTVTAARERSESMRETALKAPRSVKKEGQEVLQEQRLPCSPWWRPWGGQGKRQHEALK